MNQVYLINQASFAPYQDMSANIKAARLNTFIKKAQDLDLRLLLGDTLHYDLLKNCNSDGTLKQTAPTAYQNLLSGCTYINQQSQQIVYDGIAPALIYFTLSRFIENDNIKYTANGPVVKSGSDSIHLTYTDTVKIAQQYRSIANAYANNIENFLLSNRADFPLWHLNETAKTSRQPGPRIRAVDKTAYNYPGTDPFYNLYPITNE